MTENQQAADRPEEKEESKEETRNPERWPVLHEQPLFPAERRLWRRFRNIEILPRLRPGSVYVFASGGRYERYDDAASLRSDDPVLVAATSLSIVAVRFRRIHIVTHLPTTEVATDIPVVVSFGCEVTDPREVARAGLNDLHGELESRVRCERSLAVLRHHLSVDDIPAARNLITATLDDTYGTVPLKIWGMHVKFEGAQVQLTPELLRHHTQLRNARWLEREHRLKHAVERDRVRDIERDLLSSAERSEATAVTREERTAGQTAERQFQDRNTQTERLVGQVREWLAGDGAKRAPVDRRQLAEALFARLTNERHPEAAELSRLTGIVELPQASNGHYPAFDPGHIAPESDDAGG